MSETVGGGTFHDPRDGGHRVRGGHLVRRLVGAGEAVRCFCRPGSPGAERLKSQPVEVVCGHLHDPDGVGAGLPWRPP